MDKVLYLLEHKDEIIQKGKTIGILAITVVGIIVVALFSMGAEEDDEGNTGGMSSMSDSAWEQMRRYNRLWEAGTENETKYTNSKGEECYKVKPDGGGGSAVGFGVDIATFGAEIRKLGYSTGIGDLVPCTICEEFEDRELRKAYENIVSLETSNNISLTIYQEFALLSRCYNYGFAGGTSNGSWFQYPSSLTFVQAYKKYYDENNIHYGDWTKTDFTDDLYKQYMTALRYRSGGQPAGWIYRRESEWSLFQTGYFGYDCVRASHKGGHGFDEYCILNGGTSSLGVESFDNFLFLGDSITVMLGQNFNMTSTKEGSWPKIAGKCSTSDQYFNNAYFYAKVSMAASYWNGQLDTLPSSVNGVSVLLGINNITDTGSMKTLIDNLVNKYGDSTPIFVQKVFPVGQAYTSNYGGSAATMNTNVKTYNEAIKNYCSKYSDVEFVDNTTGLIDGSGYLKSDCTGDGLHLNSSGQSIWIKNMKDTMIGTGVGGASYTFNSTEYVVLSNATAVANKVKSNSYYQSANTSKLGNSCLGLAFAYGTAMQKNDLSQIATTSTVPDYVVGNKEKGETETDKSKKIFKETYKDTNQEIVKVIYDELAKGKVCIAHVVGSFNGSSPQNPRTRHFVTVIGYKKGVNRDTIKDTDLLILDPYSGTIKQIVSENTNGRYLLDGTRVGPPEKPGTKYTYKYLAYILK